MTHPDTTIRINRHHTVTRILLPDGIGTVEITLDLTTADGRDRIRVDVSDDSKRFGPDAKGRTWTTENGDPGPGVVFLTASPAEES
jgi:hypothetical protein